MRTTTTAIGLLFLAACASSPQPASFTGIADSGGGALNCVADRLDDRGYHPVSETTSDSFVRMERANDEQFWLNIVGIEDSFDVMDVSAQGSQVRVVTYSELVNAGERESAAPTDQARRAAREVVEECT